MRADDAFDNPQIGAQPTDFTVSYLSNPAAQLGTSAGLLQPTDRLDTFQTSFVAVDEGVAGITVSVSFAVGGTDRAVVRGNIQVKRTELVIFPSSAVMRFPQPLTIALDTAGAAHDLTVLKFIPGGQAISGLAGGCIDAPYAPLTLAVKTTSTVTATYTFAEPGEYGVCFYVNASTMPDGQGTLPAHYLAWTSKIDVRYPVQALQGGQLSLDLLINQPTTLSLQAASIGGDPYGLAGDLVTSRERTVRHLPPSSAISRHHSPSPAISSAPGRSAWLT